MVSWGWFLASGRNFCCCFLSCLGNLFEERWLWFRREGEFTRPNAMHVSFIRYNLSCVFRRNANRTAIAT